MRTKKVNRYYCDHCKKSSGAKWAMENHELRCTANPNRQCGMCAVGECCPRPLTDLVAILPDGHEYQRQIDDLHHCYGTSGEPGDNTAVACEWIDTSHEASKAVDAALPALRESADGCPACMLAALRQSGCARFSDFKWNEERKSFLACFDDMPNGRDGY